MPDNLDARKLPGPIPGVDEPPSHTHPHLRASDNAPTELLNRFELAVHHLFTPPPEARVIIEKHEIEAPTVAKNDPYFYRLFVQQLVENFSIIHPQVQQELRQSNIYDDDLTDRLTKIGLVRATNIAIEKEVELMTDDLTGMPNRVYKERVLPFWLRVAMEEGFPLTYGEGDIDRFKIVNTRVGHAGGDKIIKATTRIGAGPLRRFETFGRKQGDETYFILPGVNLGEAAAHGQVLINRSRAFLINEVPGEKFAPDEQITMSGGAAVFDPALGPSGIGRVPGEDADQATRRVLDTPGGVERYADEMTENADIAGSHAKNRPGKNGFVVYTFGMQQVTDLPIER